ncbi:MAG: phosphatidate cytidylyltransferase [Blastocatellia bacterium]|nr:phosphatidate cytidylyltransferase [Blastocatellia bacterium]
MSNLQQRILAGLIALPLLFGSLWSPEAYSFSGIVLLASLLGVTELMALAEKVGATIPRLPVYVGIMLIQGLFFFRTSPEWFIGVTVAMFTVLMIWAVLASKNQADFQKVLLSHGAALFGLIYVGYLAGFLIGIRVMTPPHRASQLLTLFFSVIMAGDTAAYFTGKAIGKHKLAPAISPGKTIEGGVGSVCGSVGFAVLAHYWFFPELPLLHAVILGIVMNVVGQIGDLYESLLKRGSGTKDAAALIPGHGGLLDRLDSLLFNAPLLYYYAIFFK